MTRPENRKNNVNYDIPKEMADSLDYILTKEGRKHAIESRSELIRRVLSDLIAYYEKDAFYKARESSKSFLSEEERTKDMKKKLRNPQLLF